MLSIGQTAPEFTLFDKDKNEVSLKDFKGKKVVVYFYPKDDTPGCTKQACAFRGAYDMFTKNDIIVIGISKDNVSSHKKFANKHELPFILLSDTDTSVVKAYDVWEEKTLFGRLGFGISRTTYIIDENGVIEKVYEKANPDTNATEILQYLCVINRN